MLWNRCFTRLFFFNFFFTCWERARVLGILENVCRSTLAVLEIAIWKCKQSRSKKVRLCDSDSCEFCEVRATWIATREFRRPLGQMLSGEAVDAINFPHVRIARRSRKGAFPTRAQRNRRRTDIEKKMCSKTYSVGNFNVNR